MEIICRFESTEYLNTKFQTKNIWRLLCTSAKYVVVERNFQEQTKKLKKPSFKVGVLKKSFVYIIQNSIKYKRFNTCLKQSLRLLEKNVFEEKI